MAELARYAAEEPAETADAVDVEAEAVVFCLSRLLAKKTNPPKTFRVYVDEAEERGRPLPDRLPGPAQTRTYYRPVEDKFVWFHEPPNAASHAHAREAFDAARRSPNLAEAIDQAARFHYRVARMMPMDRGSAGLADAMTRALLRSRDLEVGAWRRNLAPDRRAMIFDEDRFVRDYPHFFAVNDPVGLY